nr:MAG TPA: hypothetical protein [Caudoviricetes sp.]
MSLSCLRYVSWGISYPLTLQRYSKVFTPPNFK